MQAKTLEQMLALRLSIIHSFDPLLPPSVLLQRGNVIRPLIRQGKSFAECFCVTPTEPSLVPSTKQVYTVAAAHTTSE